MGTLRFEISSWVLIRLMRYLQEIQSRCISFFPAKKFGRNFYRDRNFYPNVNFGMLKKVKNRSAVNKYVATPSKSWNTCPMSWKRVKNRFTYISADSDGRNRPIRPIWQNLKISYFLSFFGHFVSFFGHFTHCKFRESLTFTWIFNAEFDHFPHIFTLSSTKYDHFTLKSWTTFSKLQVLKINIFNGKYRNTYTLYYPVYKPNGREIIERHIILYDLLP